MTVSGLRTPSSVLVLPCTAADRACNRGTRVPDRHGPAHPEPTNTPASARCAAATTTRARPTEWNRHSPFGQRTPVERRRTAGPPTLTLGPPAAAATPVRLQAMELPLHPHAPVQRSVLARCTQLPAPPNVSHPSAASQHGTSVRAGQGRALAPA